MDGGSASLAEAVTTQDIARVVRRLLDPAWLTFVVVGRSEGLEPTH
jgi:predicted Zn-dependent peptidase